MNSGNWFELLGQVVMVVVSYFAGHYVGGKKPPTKE